MFPTRMLIPLLAPLVGACLPAARDQLVTATTHAPKAEVVADFGSLVPDGGESVPVPAVPAVQLERVSAGVPWPRGMAILDGEVVVLARGRHRRAGGVDASVPDRCGALLLVDPEISEPIEPGVPASERVRNNVRLLSGPDGQVFKLHDTGLDPIDDTQMDRPYCTLILDAASRNLFVCGFSGVDLPGSKFRKNATDSIHRFDLRTKRWHPVEKHDPTVVPASELSFVVPNNYYPHHDVETSAPPHGLLNGPDGGCIAGGFLYCLGKDNHVVAQYDLRQIRERPFAPAPESRVVLGPHVFVRTPGGERQLELLGPSAAVANSGYLYLGYRTSSVIVRFRVDEQGDLVRPAVAELIAVFEPWDADQQRSANLIDMDFNSRGELFVSCAKEGRIWKLGVPDPARPFYGNDQGTRPTTAPPFIDLQSFTGKKTGTGNIVFDDQDRLYICVGNYDSGTLLAGAIYRATEIG